MKKVLTFIAALTLSVGLAQAECVFTYTATEKLESQFNNLGTPTSHEFNNGAGTVTFSKDVTMIGTQAFYQCTALQSITLPASVTTIGKSAFDNCNALQSISLPTSVTTIESNAFSGCYALQSITLPASVTTIEDGAFSGCRALTEVTVAWTEADKIPAITNNVFGWIAGGKGPSGATLHVPAGAKTLYEAAEGWKDFGTIAVIKANLTIEDFSINIPDYNIYNGDPYTATVTLKEGITGAGEITVTYKQGETVVASPINVGDYDIYMSVTEGTNYYAFPETKIGKLAIWQASCSLHDFTFTAPENLEYDGNPKVATVVFDDKSGKRTGFGEITVKYNGSTDPPINPGDYTVSIDIAEGLNYVAGFNMTDEDWKFTIPFDKYKTAAIAEIQTAGEGIQNENLNKWIGGAITDIQHSFTIEEVDRIKGQMLDIIQLYKDGKAEGIEEGKAAGKAEGLAEAKAALPTDPEGTAGAVIIITKGGKTLKLVNPDKVSYDKQ